MLKSVLAVTLLGALCGGTAVAQSISPTTLSNEAAAEGQTRLAEYIQELVETNPQIKTETWLDLDDDGLQEALIIYEAGQDGQFLWEVYGLTRNMPDRLFSWTSGAIGTIDVPALRDIDDKPIAGSARILVEADEMRFVRTKTGMAPTHDWFMTNRTPPRPATPDEMKIMETLGFHNLRSEMTSVLAGDILPEAGVERVIALNDDLHRDDFQTSPYVIVNREGAVILQGRSTFHPWTFVTSAGLQVIEDNGENFTLITLK